MGGARGCRREWRLKLATGFHATEFVFWGKGEPRDENMVVLDVLFVFFFEKNVNFWGKISRDNIPGYGGGISLDPDPGISPDRISQDDPGIPSLVVTEKNKAGGGKS